jgi:hypothetical protein
MQFSESTPPHALHATFGAHKFAAPHEGEIEFLIKSKSIVASRGCMK